MKKIIVFTTSYFPYIGGVEVAIREIASRLTGSFDFVIITARRDKKLPKSENFPEGLVRRIGFGSFFDKWLLIFFGPVLTKKYIKKGETILWGMDISQGSFSASILKFFHQDIPFVLTVQYGESKKYLKKGRGGLIGWSFRFMLNQADRVTVISNYLAELTKTYGWRKEISLVPNGISLGKSEAQSISWRTRHEIKKNENKVVITISRLVEKNGVEDLIEAMRYLPGNVILWIVGEGPLETKLKKLTSKRGLDSRVIFWGRLDNRQALGKLPQSDVFVRPSYSEGLGNAFLEAMAASVPIVGTRVGGIPDFLKDHETGLFCEKGNPKDIAQKIEQILSDSMLREKLIKNGYALVQEKYNWDNISKEMSKIFEF